MTVAPSGLSPARPLVYMLCGSRRLTPKLCLDWAVSFFPSVAKCVRSPCIHCLSRRAKIKKHVGSGLSGVFEMVFTFTLNYQLTSDESDMDTLVEHLAEEGCDDALGGVGQPGRLALEFVREAPSAHDAIQGALGDMRRAIPNARLIETALAPTDCRRPSVNASRRALCGCLISPGHSQAERYPRLQ